MAADQSTDKETLDKAVEETFASAQKIGEVMQKAQQEPAAPGSDEKKSEKKDGDVQEGEVVEE